MWKCPTFSSFVIGVILLPAAVNAGDWRYSGTALAKSEILPRGAGPAISADRPAAMPSGTAPQNNMTQNAVRTEFGDPQEQLPAVGEPPISRWRYPGYTVFFERDRVIISVPNVVGLNP